ncbi:MAG: polymerase sigma factor [Acidimicrobiales bacterium]|nr:polymerase sigma factor [Acidimicrobiales bacterium]
MITSGWENAVWSDVLGRVQAFLRRQGVDPATAEDISQEVAVRALDRRIGFTSADDLMAWACTVAKRLAVDDWRRGRRTQPDGIEMERPAAVDVAEQAVHRIQLSELSDGLSRLTDPQRAAIVSGVSGLLPRDRGETVRLAVNRHRARLRLLSWTDGIACGVARVRFRLRSWFEGGQPTLASLVPYVAAVGLMLPLPSSDAPRAVERPSLTAIARTPAVAYRTVNRSRPVAVAPPARPDRPAVARRRSGTGPAPKVEATIPTPAGQSYVVGTDETRPDDSLVCVGNIAGVPQSCFGKPIKPPL